MRIRWSGWPSWLVGLAALATVIAVAVHDTERHELVGVIERASPVWLLSVWRCRRRPTWVLLPALGLVVYSLAMITAQLRYVGRRGRRGWLARQPLIRVAVTALARGDRARSRDRAAIVVATALQLAIVILDAATLWVMARALGASPSPVLVFVAFMLSSLLRTVSIVPGGLGVFEAMSTLTLTQAGLSAELALAATLGFRGLDFWLPMLPGLWGARRAARKMHPASSS